MTYMLPTLYNAAILRHSQPQREDGLNTMEEDNEVH